MDALEKMMNKQLDRAKCEHLRDMGIDRGHDIDHWYYDRYETLWLGKEVPLSSVGGDEYIKIPSNDDLEAFAKMLVKKKREWREKSWVISTNVWSDDKYSAMFMVRGWGLCCSKDFKIEFTFPSKSLALYGLIEKLDAMIGEKDD